MSEQPTTDPAARLQAAADHLRTLTAVVPPPPWAPGGIGDYGWTVQMGDPAAREYESLDTRMDSEQGRALTRYIAAMGPSVGEALAMWLETEAHVDTEDRAALQAEGHKPAQEHAACTTASCTTEAALVVADAILAGAEQ